MEERAEVDYLDQVKLYTVEAPADREIWVERSQAEGVGQFTTLDAVIHTTERGLQPPRVGQARQHGRGRHGQGRAPRTATT